MTMPGAPELAVPSAARLQRPRWRDARLVIGVILVLSSVALGSVVVGRADNRVPVYAAGRSLVPGQRLSQADLTPVRVQLGAQAAGYLSARRALRPGRFVLREVRPGELVPAASVGSRAEVTVQPVTVSVEAGSAAMLVVGSQVDVYVNPPAAGAPDPSRSTGAFSGPQLALHAVSVSGLPREGGALGAGSTSRAVQIMAPTESIRDLIGKVDEGSRVTLVPVPGAALESAQ